jgi:proteic killer suppression protein
MVRDQGIPPSSSFATPLARTLGFSLTIYRFSIYNKLMIRSFRCSDTEKIFQGIRTKTFQNIGEIALRKLIQLHRARTLADLAAIPGNQLEALKADRAGQYSIRINKQYRICFRWEETDALDVEIVDYH